MQTTFSKEARQLEILRQKIEDVEFQAGDSSDFIDLGKPGANQKKQAEETIRKKTAEADELKRQLNALIQNTPRPIVEEWAGFHISILNLILNETPTDRKGKTRLYTAKAALEEWQGVLNGVKDYVGINWYYLKDYRQQMRKSVKRNWWRFW